MCVRSKQYKINRHQSEAVGRSGQSGNSGSNSGRTFRKKRHQIEAVPFVFAKGIGNMLNKRPLVGGRFFKSRELTRDHIVPKSKGGVDDWMNVVAACRRCNQFKGDKLLENSGMSLIALPYRPNAAEYLALVNSQRILPDQADYLRTQFSKNCRWKSRNRNTSSGLLQPS